MSQLFLSRGRPTSVPHRLFLSLVRVRVEAATAEDANQAFPTGAQSPGFHAPGLWRWRGGASDGSRYSVFSFKETPAAAALLLLPMSLLSVHPPSTPPRPLHSPTHTAAAACSGSGQRSGDTEFFIHFPSNPCRCITVHVTAQHNLVVFFLRFFAQKGGFIDPERVQ